MGQKTNPIGLRLGVNKQWSSIWFDEQNYAERLHEDAILRKYLFNKFAISIFVPTPSVLATSLGDFKFFGILEIDPKLPIF